MMKRFALLLAALFVASMVLVAPVFASGNHENNNGGDNEKVCVLHKDKGDEHNNGEHKDYRWVSKHDKHHGDKVVKDKFCQHKDNNGEHKDNNGEHRNNGEHKGNNGEHKDNNGEHKDNGDNNNNDNGHANNDNDNGHANNNDDDDWS
jgi:hypothetical protein